MGGAALSYSGAISFLRHQVSSYSQCEGGDSWKPHYKEAMACRDLEVRIEVGNALFRSLKKYVNGDDGLESEILDIVGWWLRPCEAAESGIHFFEAKGYSVEGVKEFRKNRGEAVELVRRLPTKWRGQKIYRKSELAEIDFPFPPEPE